ncbi:alpha beta hydrolase fold protein [Diplodia corticola]|uniref:Alpha beta hydrolase fold protein n=1 Tax=Diplodia corticola TaxID=236234 RepID=A0A1J9SMA0_9PEZI|nr:alpha beta hydrolase fold protein [Diplodia corticola]OJD40741.1 alpha beta hydrolase fold protein [Diplodia corticola]
MPPRPADQVRLSLLEKVKLVLFYAVVITKTCGTALAAPFTASEKRSRVFKRHVAYAFVRHCFTNSNSRIEQAITTDTDELYYEWARKTKVAPAREVLPDGTEAFWIGSKDAKTVLLYFHGGGYNLPALPAHINFCARLVDDVSPSTQGDFSVLLLHYDYHPFGHYPRQLGQAAALFKHAVDTLAIPNVLIGGDSAGGNMAVGLLSHLLHPHPDADVVARVAAHDMPNRIRGALLVSPWADPFGGDDVYPSLRRNEPKDLLAGKFLRRWADAWAGGKPEDAYNRPTAAPAGWWKGVDRVLERFLVVIGADDVLLDGALGFARGFAGEWRDAKDAQIAVVEDEGHISGIVDADMGFSADEVRMYVQIRDWLKSVVAG